MGVYIAQGFLNLLDAQQRYVRAGHSVYYRLRNFPDLQASSQAIQLGFGYSPTGNMTGTTDTLIDPPPAVEAVSQTAVARSMGKLRFGARKFLISATFVNNQVTAQGLSNQDLVWRGPNVVGLFCDNQLFSIEDIFHKEYGGVTINWIITANALETIQPGIS